MSNDTELMELCKEVYKRTEWDAIKDDLYDLDYAFYLEDDGTHRPFLVSWYGPDVEWTAPLYTSDFLLEKLPAKVRDTTIEIIKRHDGTWYAGYSFGHDVNDDNAEILIHAEASTLLHASLKLIIALDDAGELSHV
jgi:hypothetical protein